MEVGEDLLDHFRILDAGDEPAPLTTTVTCLCPRLASVTQLVSTRLLAEWPLMWGKRSGDWSKPLYTLLRENLTAPPKECGFFGQLIIGRVQFNSIELGSIGLQKIRFTGFCRIDLTNPLFVTPDRTSVINKDRGSCWSGFSCQQTIRGCMVCRKGKWSTRFV